MKRTFDIFFSSLALVVLAPVLLAVALLVRLDSPGPVFFRQVRVGQERRSFHILKFRSMVVDAEKMGGYSTSDGDRRITPVGRFIRRTSLDELPQLINVLRGDMSIVGPRPDVPAQEALYTAEEWVERHRVRPGITGLAQAGLRSAATPEQRKQLDLEYVRKRSLVLDCAIVLNTVRQVVFKGGN
jgi:lipopolysaccharide/colanic/teichoic acid biosynthesis glycosyltransferase